MKQDNPIAGNWSALRYGMLVPLALIIVAFISCCFSYSDAKRIIANELNDAIIALANENGEQWTRPDTIAALRQVYEITHKPLIYQVPDMNFRNSVLKEDAYFTIALVDKKNASPEIRGSKIASDSIMLVPERGVDGLAVQIQGFADCSMASVLAVSDQTLPAILLTLSILSIVGLYLSQRKATGISEIAVVSKPSARDALDAIKLTPMQRQFVQMLIDAPNMRVDKKVLCEALWGNKSNAEESLYTLVRRTKSALVNANIQIRCNRGDSYELHVND